MAAKPAVFTSEALAASDAALDIMRRIADASALAMCAEAESAELDESTLVVSHAISLAQRSERLHKALELSASSNARAMESLRIAVCEFTVALRGEGASPEAILIAVKSLIGQKSLPHLSYSRLDLDAQRLRGDISKWCIESYFKEAAPCA
jgi:hypothetical protein